MHEPRSDKPVIVSRFFAQIKVFIILTLLAGCAGPRETVESGPPEEIRSVIAAAREAGEVGEYERALDLYLGIMGETDNVAVARGAAQLASAMENWPAAGAAAERWLELRPASQSAAQLAVIAALRQNRLEHAVELMRLEILSDDDRDASWMTAAALLAAADSDELARQGLDRLLDATAPLPDGFALYQRSRLARQLGDIDAAIDLAVEAYRGAPDFQRAMWVSHTAREAGQTGRALEFLRRAREHRPENADVALAESELLRELGRVDEALQALEGLSDSPEVLYSRGMLQQQLGQTGPAKESWQQLAALEIGIDPDRHAWLTGLLAEVLDMNTEARAWYGRVGGELSTSANLRRALLLADQGRVDDARSLLSELRTQPDPDMVEQAWLVEAQILVDQGLADSAIDMLSEALVEMPGSTALLYGRAMTAVNLDRLALAEQDLRTVIQLEPENAEALNALGYTLSDRTDRQREAARIIERALELEPENPAILDSMGWVLFKLGRAEQALPYLQKAADADAHPEIVAHLIEVLWVLGRRDEAMAWVDRTRELLGGEDVYDQTLSRLGIE